MDFVQPTLTAVCESLVVQWEREEEGSNQNEVIRFVSGSLKRMPRVLRYGIVMLTGLVGVISIFRFRKSCSRLNRTECAQLIEDLRHSRILPFNDLIRFYESLCVVSLYSQYSERSSRGSV